MYGIRSSPPLIANVNVMVFRRYNDFKWLRAQLSASFPALYIPPLPRQQSLKRFDAKLIEQRRRDLERLLNALCAVRLRK